MRLFLFFPLLINYATSSFEVVIVKTTPTIQDRLIDAIIHVESRGDSMAYNAGRRCGRRATNTPYHDARG